MKFKKYLSIRNIIFVFVFVVMAALLVFSFVNYRRTTNLLESLQYQEQQRGQEKQDENDNEEISQFAQTWNNTNNFHQDTVSEEEFNQRQESSSSEMVVEVKEVGFESVVDSSSYRGIIEPAKKMFVMPKQGGRVEEVFVEVGDFVQKGETLFTLETDEIEEKKEQARAAIKAAESQLEMAQSGSRNEEIRQLESGVRQAESQVQMAENSYDRVKNLYEENIITAQEYEEVKTKKETAHEDLEQVKEKLSMAKAGAREEEVKAAQAKLQQAQREYNLAQIAYEDTIIKAQNDGYVSKVVPEKGSMVSNEEPSVIKVDLDQVHVVLEVGERERRKISSGQKAQVTVDALPGEEFDGIVSEVNPAADTESRLFEVKVEVDNPDNKIKAGMYGRTEIITREKTNVLTVPQSAIREMKDEEMVYVIENNAVEPREIETGEQIGNQVVIERGLEARELVVIEEEVEVVPGQPVDIERVDSQ